MMYINHGLGMNGLETAREIRKLRAYRNILIVAVTEYTLACEKEKILENGFSDYISKPFKREQLLDASIRVLEHDYTNTLT